MTFTKQRILQMWEQEKRRLQSLLPSAKDNREFLTIGHQMIIRMKPLLEQGYRKEHPNEMPYLVNLICWIRDNGWDEMHSEFKFILDNLMEYNKASRLI